MLETMVASGQQALETSNEDTVYYDYYPPEYTHYPGQGSPELCPTVYDYGKFTHLQLHSSARVRRILMVGHGGSLGEILKNVEEFV